MHRSRLVSLDNRADWEAELLDVPHSFGHTWDSCYAFSRDSQLPTYLWVYEASEAKAVCTFSERPIGSHIDIMKPFGFSGFTSCPDTSGLEAAWLEFTASRGYVCGYLGLDPVRPISGWSSEAGMQQYDRVHLVDLKGGAEEMWSNLSQRRRRGLKNWQADRAALIHDKAVLVPFLVGQFEEFMQRKQASSTYRFSAQVLAALCESKNVFMLGVGSAERVLAVSLFGVTPHVGEWIFHVYAPDSEPYSALLIWCGALQLKESGVPLLNLGGGNEAIHEFKRGFGTMEMPLCCLKQIYDEKSYKSICSAVGRDPDGGGYFPAYR